MLTLRVSANGAVFYRSTFMTRERFIGHVHTQSVADVSGEWATVFTARGPNGQWVAEYLPDPFDAVKVLIAAAGQLPLEL